MSDGAGQVSDGPGDAHITTLLGQGCEFSGKLTFEGTVRIDGRFSGEILSEGTLVVGEGAEIKADVSVRRLLVKGEMEGDLTALESIEIHAPGRVRGKLCCPELEIQKGVQFDGTCEMSQGADRRARVGPEPAAKGEDP